MTAMALGMPLAISVVPSIGSTATSHSAPWPSPTSSPLNSMGASSFSPSPRTTTPRMLTVPMSARMASTAAPSPPFLSPRPTQRPAAIAAASVTRTSSGGRLGWGAGRSVRKPRFVGEPSGTGSTGPPDRTTGAGGKGVELCCDPRCMTAAGPPSQRPPGTDDVPAPDQEPAPSPAVQRAARVNAANMVRSLLPLVLICLVIVWWTSFRQSPDVQPVRTVDTTSTIDLAVARASYPIQVPQHLPEGYRPTSARTDAGNATAGDPVTVEIGYVTPSDEFAGFVISDDRRAEPVAQVLDGADEHG